MPEKPSVVYAVTEKHMAQLSALSAGAVLSMDLGEANFLEAICEAVWPGMRIRLENERASEVQAPGGAQMPTRFVDVKGLRKYTVIVEAKALTEQYWDQRERRQAEYASAGPFFMQVLQQRNEEEALRFHDGTRTLWAADSDEARKTVSDDLAKRGIVAELTVKEGTSP